MDAHSSESPEVASVEQRRRRFNRDMLVVAILVVVVALAVFGGTILKYFGAPHEPPSGEPHHLDDY